MADTIVKMKLIPSSNPYYILLRTTAAGQVTPDANGYTVTAGTGWDYTSTVSDAVVGIYGVDVYDALDQLIGSGYVRIEADDTNTYIADTSYQLLASMHDISTMGTVVDSILVDTNQLQADWTNGGRLDLILDAIQGKSNLLSSTSITFSAMVNPTTMAISAPIVIGDDYLDSNGRAFEWTINAITGATAAASTSQLGFSDHCGHSMIVDGDVSDNGDGTWTLTHEISATDFPTTISEGMYEWTVTVTVGSGAKISVARNSTPVYFVAKQT